MSLKLGESWEAEALQEAIMTWLTGPHNSTDVPLKPLIMHKLTMLHSTLTHPVSWSH